jgi:hypothetical protein
MDTVLHYTSVTRLASDGENSSVFSSDIFDFNVLNVFKVATSILSIDV